MAYARLFLLVEGPDDERFVERILKPRLAKGRDVFVLAYAERRAEKVEALLRSIQAMGAEYLLLADINSAPCVTSKKDSLFTAYAIIALQKIVVVIKEIESWYLAGLDATRSRQLGVRNYATTDDIAKEQFNALVPSKYGSRLEFMLEILSYYSVQTAIRKNKSFRYLMDKHLPGT